MKNQSWNVTKLCGETTIVTITKMLSFDAKALVYDNVSHLVQLVTMPTMQTVVASHAIVTVKPV